MLYVKKRKNNSNIGKTKSLVWFGNKHMMRQGVRQSKRYRSSCDIVRRMNFNKFGSKSLMPLRDNQPKKQQRASKNGSKLNFNMLRNNWQRHYGAKLYKLLKSS